jgi:hypothetical protein
MGRVRVVVVYVLVCCFCFAAQARCEEPQKVSVCQLKAHPPAYNHTLIEVEGFVSHDFEDFTLFDPACPDWPAVWLEYGGKVNSDTTSCCGRTAARSHRQELQVEGISVPLVHDALYRQFDKEIQPPFRSGNFGSIVHATLIGRFFAGREEQFGNGEPFWDAYGHMGCCSLLAIQEVQSVDPQDRGDLDYGASYDQPTAEKVGCGYEDLAPIKRSGDPIRAQQRADQGEEAWAFQDPRRVASDALIRLAKIKTAGPLGLKETRRAEGRIVYEWSESGESFPFMVVVSRPFWLSRYARDPKRVAWVAVAVYRFSCD